MRADGRPARLKIRRSRTCAFETSGSSASPVGSSSSGWVAAAIEQEARSAQKARTTSPNTGSPDMAKRAPAMRTANQGSVTAPYASIRGQAWATPAVRRRRTLALSTSCQNVCVAHLSALRADAGPAGRTRSANLIWAWESARSTMTQARPSTLCASLIRLGFPITRSVQKTRNASPCSAIAGLARS